MASLDLLDPQDCPENHIDLKRVLLETPARRENPVKTAFLASLEVRESRATGVSLG